MMQVYRSVPVMQLAATHAIRASPLLIQKRTMILGFAIKSAIDLTAISTSAAAVRRITGFDFKPYAMNIKDEKMRNFSLGYLFYGEKWADFFVNQWERCTLKCKNENREKYEKYQRQYDSKKNQYSDEFQRYKDAKNYDSSKHMYPDKYE
ncbi:hypothetical protein WA158_002497 [Blastocystis sp. Blastoise]